MTHTILLKYPHPGLEVLPGILPVLLDAQVVNQGRAAGGHQEIEEDDELVEGKLDQDEADSLQQPVEHVETH